MSLAERLAGKQRRRASVRVVIDALAAGAAVTRVQQQQAAVSTARFLGDQAMLATAEADLAAARAALDAAVEEIWFSALDPDDYEALIASFMGEDGELDEHAALPHLAAACAEDESLRAEQWWVAEIGSGRWNAGEVADLLTTLVSLNYAVPGPGPGKG